MPETPTRTRVSFRECLQTRYCTYGLALYTRDPGKFAALTKAIEQARADKDAAEERWLDLAEKAEGLAG